MDLQQLEAFHMIARLRNVHRASELLHLTQPAISTRISKLEKELGVALFYRDGEMRLTKYGASLEKYAEQILALTSEAKEAIEQLKEVGTACLTIGTTRRTGTYILPDFLSEFQIQYPQIKVTVHSESATAILKMLSNGEIDVGFVSKLPPDKSFAGFPIIHDSIVLAVSPSHPLYQIYLKQNLITCRDINQCTIIYFNHFATYYHTIFDLLKDIRPAKLINVDNGEALKRMVIRNIGVAFIPKIAIQKELADMQLMEIPLPDGITIRRDTVMVYKQGPFINPTVLPFVKTVKEFLLRSDSGHM